MLPYFILPYSILFPFLLLLKFAYLDIRRPSPSRAMDGDIAARASADAFRRAADFQRSLPLFVEPWSCQSHTCADPRAYNVDIHMCAIMLVENTPPSAVLSVLN